MSNRCSGDQFRVLASFGSTNRFPRWAPFRRPVSRGLPSARTRSLRVVRDIGWFRPHIEIGARMARTLVCLCRACRSG
jgi:hypothetical protein